MWINCTNYFYNGDRPQANSCRLRNVCLRVTGLITAWRGNSARSLHISLPVIFFVVQHSNQSQHQVSNRVQLTLGLPRRCFSYHLLLTSTRWTGPHCSRNSAWASPQYYYNLKGYDMCSSNSRGKKHKHQLLLQRLPKQIYYAMFVWG